MSEIATKVETEAVEKEKYFKDNCIKGVFFVALTWIAIKLGGSSESKSTTAPPKKRWEDQNAVASSTNRTNSLK